MKRKLRKYRGCNRHHLRPKSRRGSGSESNLLLIDCTKHEYWHKLWGNKTLDEIITLLTRLKAAKHYQEG